MEITDVKIFKIAKRGALVGYANIVLNNCFIIRGIKILETQDKRFVAMPSRKLRGTSDRTSYRDIAHPVNQQMREDLTIAILNAFDQEM